MINFTKPFVCLLPAPRISCLILAFTLSSCGGEKAGESEEEDLDAATSPAENPSPTIKQPVVPVSGSNQAKPSTKVIVPEPAVVDPVLQGIAKDESDPLSKALKIVTKTPVLKVAPLPDQLTHLTSFNLKVSGEFVHSYAYKIQAGVLTTCDSQGYGAAVGVDQVLLLDTSPLQNQELTLCVLGYSESGESTSDSNSVRHSWRHDATVPASVQSFLVRSLNSDGVLLSFDSLPASVDSLLIVRSEGAESVWQPTIAETYQVGQTVSDGASVVYFGPSVSQFTDESSKKSPESYYAVFTRSRSGVYSAATIRSGSAEQNGPETIREQGFGGAVRTLAFDSEARLYAGGSFLTHGSKVAQRIMRFTSDLLPDPSFLFSSGFNADVLSLLPTEKQLLYVGGSFTTYGKTTVGRLVRLTEEGSIDDSFKLGAGFNNLIYALAEEPKSRDVFVAGAFTSINKKTANRLVRLSPAGEIVSSFNIGSGFNNNALTLHVDAQNNRLFVGGRFTTFNGKPANRLVCLKLDSGSFCDDFELGAGGDNDVLAITSSPKGDQIFVGGNFTKWNGVSSPRIVSLGFKGNSSESFVVGAGFNSSVNSLHATEEGGVIAVGAFSTYLGKPAGRVIKLTSTGALDPSFETAKAFNQTALTAVKHPERHTLVVGGAFTLHQATPKVRIAELEKNGLVTASLPASLGVNNWIYGFTEDTSSGDLWSYGAFTSFGSLAQSRVAKLNSDLSAETSFSFGTGFNNSVYAALYDEKSQWVRFFGSFTSTNKINTSRITRVHRSGKIDPSYAKGVVLDNSIFAAVDDPHMLGSTVVGGAFTKFNTTVRRYLARLNAEGQLDTSFATQGGPDKLVRTVVRSVDGESIYVGGDFTTYDGKASGRFAVVDAKDGSIKVATGAGFGGSVHAVSSLPDELIAVGGAFKTYRGVTANYFSVINAQGDVVNKFNCGTCFNGAVRTIVWHEPSQTMFVGGDFSTYNKVSANRIVRLDLDGKNVSSQLFGSGFDNSVYALFVKNNQLYIGGNFSTFNTYFRERLVRLDLQ